jgi:formate hydrogenlyase subunit 6/NADH:ubiquinone oxidoreductase subunit I
MAGLDRSGKDVIEMRIGIMLPDVSGALFRRPATENYPLVRNSDPVRLRSFLQWDPEACTGCGLCAMDCPAEAIHVTVLDRKEKRFVMAYYVDRCTFCGQCVESCRQGSLSMANDHWELAALNKDPFLVYLGDEDDVTEVLAGKPAGGPEAPEKA